MNERIGRALEAAAGPAARRPHSGHAGSRGRAAPGNDNLTDDILSI